MGRDSAKGHALAKTGHTPSDRRLDMEGETMALQTVRCGLCAETHGAHDTRAIIGTMHGYAVENAITDHFHRCHLTEYLELQRMAEDLRTLKKRYHARDVRV